MTLEELLNKLIEKGWDVFPDKKFFGNKDKLRFSKGKKCVWFGNDDYTLRELVSKESNLWQFCVENGMLDEDKCWFSDYRRHNWMKDHGDGDKFIFYNTEEYEYRLIEASLKNEDELESFILENIKIDE